MTILEKKHPSMILATNWNPNIQTYQFLFLFSKFGDYNPQNIFLHFSIFNFTTHKKSLGGR